MTTVKATLLSSDGRIVLSELPEDRDFVLSMSRFFAVCDFFERSIEPTSYLQAAQDDPQAFSKLSDLQKETDPTFGYYFDGSSC